jgi:hypothetical protein
MGQHVGRCSVPPRRETDGHGIIGSWSPFAHIGRPPECQRSPTTAFTVARPMAGAGLRAAAATASGLLRQARDGMPTYRNGPASAQVFRWVNGKNSRQYGFYVDCGCGRLCVNW